jgi:hypothetical protein
VAVRAAGRQSCNLVSRTVAGARSPRPPAQRPLPLNRVGRTASSSMGHSARHPARSASAAAAAAALSILLLATAAAPASARSLLQASPFYEHPPL